MESIFIRVVIFSALLICCNSYRYLFLPIPGTSHVMQQMSIAEELASRGHEVHILLGRTNERARSLVGNDSHVHVQLYGSLLESEQGGVDYEKIQENMTRTMLEERADIGDMAGFIEKFVLAEVQQLLVNNEELFDRLDKVRFDLAVVESIFFMKFLYMIPLRVGIPWITYTDFVPSNIVRVPFLPSFYPIKVTEFTEKMSLTERIRNTFTTIMLLCKEFVHIPEQVLNDYREYEEFDSLDDLIARSRLFITSHHILLDYPVPVTPNLITVGGLTTGKKSSVVKQLPKDIDDFMSGDKDGVILVTFGSMAASLPVKTALKFIEAFKQLPGYRFIWRLKNVDNLPIPDNVMVAKWLPQQDILADKRVRLFITHSGSNGQFEALYHAVPMIGFPIAGDQPYNARRLDHKGYGIGMDVHDFTSEELIGNINRILSDDSYKNRISKASEIFRSERDSPAEKAAYWIEHVTKYGGDHLRSAGNDLAFYEYLMLDVLFLVLFIVLVVLFALFNLLKFVTKKCCRKSDNAKVKSQKKNN